MSRILIILLFFSCTVNAQDREDSEVKIFYLIVSSDTDKDIKILLGGDVVFDGLLIKGSLHFIPFLSNKLEKRVVVDVNEWKKKEYEIEIGSENTSIYLYEEREYIDYFEGLNPVFAKEKGEFISIEYFNKIEDIFSPLMESY